jgi:hypothetical protein
MIDPVGEARDIVAEAIEKHELAVEFAAKVRERLSAQEIRAALASPDPKLALLNALLAAQKRSG